MNAAALAELVVHGTQMIAEIVGYIADAHAGKLDPNDAMAKIAEVHAKILADRAAIDAGFAKLDATPIPTGLPGPGE